MNVEKLWEVFSTSVFLLVFHYSTPWCNVFLVHSYDTCDTFSQSVSLLIAVRKAFPRCPYLISAVACCSLACLVCMGTLLLSPFKSCKHFVFSLACIISLFQPITSHFILLCVRTEYNVNNQFVLFCLCSTCYQLLYSYYESSFLNRNH